MVSTVEAAFLFALLVVPGFVFLRGYFRGRTRAEQQVDLYVLAEAVVASLALLAIAWPLGAHAIVAWADDGVLVEQHGGWMMAFFLVSISIPYLLGLAAGRAVDALTDSRPLPKLTMPAWWSSRLEARGIEVTERNLAILNEITERVHVRLFRRLERLGLLQGPTVWDSTWREVRASGRAWVRVRLRSGSVVTGIFADRSRVGTSPLPHELYLEQVYDGTDGRSSVYIDGTEVVSVEFAELAERNR